MTDTSTEEAGRLVVRLMQARDHAQRFIDHYFKNDAPRPQISIPASPKYDSDLIVHQAIKDARETLPALAAERDKWHAGWMEAEAKVSELEAERDALKAEVERLHDVLTDMRDDKVGFRHVSHFRRRAAVALQESTNA